MPDRTKTVVELTLDELNQMLQDAAAEGARAVSEDLREKADHLDRAARVEAGLITLCIERQMQCNSRSRRKTSSRQPV